MEIASYRPLEARDLKKLPERSISDLEWIMSDGLYVQLYSADGKRSVDVQCAALLQAMNGCVVLAEACGLGLVELGSILDEIDHGRREHSAYATAYVKSRLPDTYWLQRAEHIVALAPEGSGTREALRYLLATVRAQHVLS